MPRFSVFISKVAGAICEYVAELITFFSTKLVLPLSLFSLKSATLGEVSLVTGEFWAFGCVVIMKAPLVAVIWLLLAPCICSIVILEGVLLSWLIVSV